MTSLQKGKNWSAGVEGSVSGSVEDIDSSPIWESTKGRRGMIWMVRLSRKEMDQRYRQRSRSAKPGLVR